MIETGSGKQPGEVDKIEEALMGMPYKYTLKEDYIRSMAMVDKKLDQILEYQRRSANA